MEKGKERNIVECTICPYACKIGEGATGICGVRKNVSGKIELLTWGVISGYAFDPVEKKPLYHFFPGRKILSIGSWGCNMRCDYCQNYHISQNIFSGAAQKVKPEEILRDSLRDNQNIGVAFTYNEPVIWYEYVRDVAHLVKEAGQATVMVTNGYVSEKALFEYLEYIDAFNVDLKAFNNDFYKRLTGATLEPVKKALRIIAGSGRHLEITTLIIPGRNDSVREMVDEASWIADEVGRDVPLHLSRYFPMYKRNDPATPEETLLRLYETARKYLSYVYIGNLAGVSGQDTYCPGCNNIVTRRSGYRISHPGLKLNRCSVCGKEIYRYFTSSSCLN